MTPTHFTAISGIGQRFAPRSDGLRDSVTTINGLALPGVTAKYHFWTVDHDELATCIKAKVSAEPTTRLVFVCHSKGGDVACRVATRLGLPCLMVFADVWTRERTLLVPKLCTDLWSWRETWDHPRGAELIPWEGTRWHVNEIVDGVAHAKMDSLPEMVATVLSLAKGEL